eukprot:TRINITY_DN113856_c0_g1_i1.p1 TRINITY_DN113856_c0_g1~~TRINITY_DN113856_c0_g1_i1.p1  ORF type:complete len:419 (-),score=67.06 TRINITY_DN113856_c0_g1_i1:271-1527(-)
MCDESPAKRQKISNGLDIERYANRNTGQRGEFSPKQRIGEGQYKYVVKGVYKPSGKPNVWKFLHSGTTFSDDCFNYDIKAAEAALPLIAHFNNYISKTFPQACVMLNIPEVWEQTNGLDGLKGQTMLVEPLIEGFAKFNSNSGASDPSALVAQALSHFSYHASDGTKLLCDLQGGKQHDNYVLSDIVTLSSDKSFGPTDLGLPGIENFFNQHKCNQFCCKSWKKVGAAKKFFQPVMGTTMMLPHQAAPFKPEIAAVMRKDYKFLFPSEIGFTQDSIKSEFQSGESLLQSAIKVANHDIQKRDIPMIHIVWSDRHNKYFSLDNRRLAAFRLLEMCGKTRKIKCTVEDMKSKCDEFNRKFDSKDGGKTIRVRGTNKIVGTSTSNTTFDLQQIRLATAHHDKAHVKDEDLQIYLATVLADS